MFTEMRTASLIQKALHGAQTLPAPAMLRMATIDGARALGLEKEIGTIEVGKRADLTLINLNRLHTTPHPDPISTIVYAAEASDVDTVIIDGLVVMRAGALTTLDEQAVLREATRAIATLAQSL
jgi:cytosine/adenosine deaminase-related metal-dependent hydrolase